MKRLIILISFISAVCCMKTQAQNLKASEVQTLVNNKTYIFEAQTVTPASGGLRQLTPGYILKVSGDSLVANLPYFGKAYTAPMNPADAGIHFVSTKFDYKITEGKKQRYQVSIRSKDRTFDSDFLLTVYDNGSAFLQVNSADRQPISFNGYIKNTN